MYSTCQAQRQTAHMLLGEACPGMKLNLGRGATSAWAVRVSECQCPTIAAVILLQLTTWQTCLTPCMTPCVTTIVLWWTLQMHTSHPVAHAFSHWQAPSLVICHWRHTKGVPLPGASTTVPPAVSEAPASATAVGRPKLLLCAPCTTSCCVEWFLVLLDAVPGTNLSVQAEFMLIWMRCCCCCCKPQAGHSPIT